MNALAPWLRAEARRQARRPDLPSALLAGRGFAYARHRIGFMALRLLVRTGLTALELQLLMLAFVPFDELVPLIGVRALSGLAMAAHWGALEALREGVRAAFRQHQRARVRVLIERWLGVSLAGSLAVVGYVGLVAWQTARSPSITLLQAYLLACLIRLALETATRVLHSGVFALRRVYRPLWSLIAVDVIELVTLVAGFDALGAWTIPLGIVIAGAIDTPLTLVYVRRAYRQHGFEQPRLSGAIRAWLRPQRALRSAASRLWHSAREIAGHAFANLLLQLDALVLLVLLGAPDASAAFALLYYALRPLFAISTHWVRTFYFDLKQIEAGPLAALGARLLRYLERLAFVLALAVGLLVVGLALFVLDLGWSAQLLWLLPFILVRSSFALWQIVSFGAGRYRELSLATLAVLIGLAAIHLLELAEATSLVAITLLLAALLTLASRRPAVSGRAGIDAARDGRPHACSLGHCLARLEAARQVQLGVVTLRPNGPTAGAVIRALLLARPDLIVTRWSRRELLLFSESTEALTRAALVIASGGNLARAWVSPSLPPRAALARAEHARALPDGLRALLRACERAPSVAALRERFAARYPNGQVCDLAGRDAGLSVRAVNAQQLRSLIRALHSHGRSDRLREARRLPFSLAVYAPGGQARMLFVAERGAPEFAEFRRLVQHTSVRASFPEALRPQADDAPDAVHA